MDLVSEPHCTLKPEHEPVLCYPGYGTLLPLRFAHRASWAPQHQHFRRGLKAPDFEFRTRKPRSICKLKDMCPTAFHRARTTSQTVE